jgi:hypothetical protein
MIVVEFKYIAKKELSDNDFRTQAALKYPNIPAGAEVEHIETITNFYGRYAKVRWNRTLYYVKPDDIKKIECDE